MVLPECHPPHPTNTHLIFEFDVHVSLMLLMLKEDLGNLYMSTRRCYMEKGLTSLDKGRKRGGAGGGR